jgi:hypothetical protein
MDLQAHKILLLSIVEVQECIQELNSKGLTDFTPALWEVQIEKAERLKNGDYYTSPNSRRTPGDSEGDGEGS